MQSRYLNQHWGFVGRGLSRTQDALGDGAPPLIIYIIQETQRVQLDIVVMEHSRVSN